MRLKGQLSHAGDASDIHYLHIAAAGKPAAALDPDLQEVPLSTPHPLSVATITIAQLDDLNAISAKRFSSLRESAWIQATSRIRVTAPDAIKAAWFGYATPRDGELHLFAATASKPCELGYDSPYSTTGELHELLASSHPVDRLYACLGLLHRAKHGGVGLSADEPRLQGMLSRLILDNPALMYSRLSVKPQVPGAYHGVVAALVRLDKRLPTLDQGFTEAELRAFLANPSACETLSDRFSVLSSYKGDLGYDPRQMPAAFFLSVLELYDLAAKRGKPIHCLKSERDGTGIDDFELAFGASFWAQFVLRAGADEATTDAFKRALTAPAFSRAGQWWRPSAACPILARRDDGKHDLTPLGMERVIRSALFGGGGQPPIGASSALTAEAGSGSLPRTEQRVRSAISALVACGLHSSAKEAAEWVVDRVLQGSRPPTCDTEAAFEFLDVVATCGARVDDKVFSSSPAWEAAQAMQAARDSMTSIIGKIKANTASSVPHARRQTL